MGSPGTQGLFSVLLGHYFNKIAELEETNISDIRRRWTIWKSLRTQSATFKSICEGSSESLLVINEDNTGANGFILENSGTTNLGETDLKTGDKDNSDNVINEDTLQVLVTNSLPVIDEDEDEYKSTSPSYTTEKRFPGSMTVGSTWLNHGERIQIKKNTSRKIRDVRTHSLATGSDESVLSDRERSEQNAGLASRHFEGSAFWSQGDRKVDSSSGGRKKCLRTEINGQAHWFLPDYNLVVRREDNEFTVIGKISRNRQNIFALARSDIIVCKQNDWKYESSMDKESDNDSDVEEVP